MLTGIAKVLTTVGSVFSSDTPIGNIIDEIKNDKLTADQKVELEKINIENHRLDNEDKADLRKTNALDVNKLNFTIANISANLNGIGLIAFGAFGKVSQETQGMLIAAGIAVLGAYYGYWLGSSIGSSIKNNWKGRI